MKNIILYSGLLLIAIFFTTIILSDDLVAADHFKKGSRFKYMDQLTEEQRETIKDTIRDLRTSGTSPEDIHEKVKDLLTEYGIEVPDDAELFPRMRGHRPGRILMRNKNPR